MIPKECVERVRHSLVQVADHGRSITFRNPERELFVRIRVDGCVSKDGRRADFVVEKGRSAIVIELKRGSVENGVKQVFNTAELWCSLKRVDRICGLLVGKSSPGITSAMQVKKIRFSRAYGFPLHVVTSTSFLTFENAFRARGVAAP